MSCRPMFHSAVVAALAAAAAAGGCTREAQPVAPSTASAAEADTSEAVDRLRSLPYAGFSGGRDDAQDGVVVHDETRAYPGYNLVSVHDRCRADLIDMHGRVLRSWRHDGSASWSNVELLDNGDLLAVGWDANEAGESGIADQKRYLLRFAWDGTLLWKRPMAAHHDVEVTPRGELLTLTFERRRIPEIHSEIEVRDDRLTRLDPDGRNPRSMSLYDLVSRSPAVFPLQRVAPNTAGGEPWIDLFHGNSIEWMHRPALAARDPLYGPSNVLACFRNQDRIAIFDLDRERVLWAWGAGMLSGPHDAQVLDDGTVLVFDNGLARGWSRVVQVDPLRGEIVWEYRARDPRSLFTASRGSAQRLPNGNTLIANSDNGTAFEITRDGEEVWRYNIPERDERGHRATIVRVKRYEPAFVEALPAD